MSEKLGYTPMGRNEYEEYLRMLTPQEQVEDLRQFFIDMMDWTEQSDGCDIYIALEKFLNSIKLN